MKLCGQSHVWLLTAHVKKLREPAHAKQLPSAALEKVVGYDPLLPVRNRHNSAQAIRSACERASQRVASDSPYVS
jgi:hypothetical protein